ncbi:NAD-dependent epimerase/dehydratase family protein [Frateuria aurantia]
MVMRVVLTGSSGRVGRAVFGALAADHEVLGLDHRPFATTHWLGDVGDCRLLRSAMAGADAVIHTASLHAPHVGRMPDSEFERINVQAVRHLIEVALESKVATVVYTSTTALYGHAVRKGSCAWIDEQTDVQPRTIYHRSKLQAEALLESAAGPALAVRVLRISRCFPEPVDRMAVYRLHRGIDLRDVATAHRSALHAGGAAFQRYIVSGRTPFQRPDTGRLAVEADSVIALRCPALQQAFGTRGWSMPNQIDRVYDPGAIEQALGWRSQYGFENVLRQYEEHSIEVLPCMSWLCDPVAE